MHPPGVDAEEKGTKEYEAEQQGSGGEEVALAIADDGGGGESRWKEGGDGLDGVKDLSQQRKMAGGAVVAALQAGIEVEIDVLKTERGEEKECGEDLACAAGGEPALDPDEQHAGEEDVCQGKGGEYES